MTEDWVKGKIWGRGELAEELLRQVRSEDADGHGLINVNLNWLREVAKLHDKPYGK